VNSISQEEHLMMSFAKVTLFASLIANFSASTALATSIDWKLEAARSSGTLIFDNGPSLPACPMQGQRAPGSAGVSIIGNGNDFSISLPDTELDLDRWEKSGRFNCRIVIPGSVQSGYAISEIETTLNYGIHKGKGAEGKVSVGSRLATVGTAEPTVMTYSPSESTNLPKEVLVDLHDLSAEHSRFCNQRNETAVNLVTDVVFQGEKSRRSEILTISLKTVDGYKQNLDVTVHTKKCAY
jgi:hypothetical protein